MMCTKQPEKVGMKRPVYEIICTHSQMLVVV